MSNNTPSGKKPEKTLASSVWRQLRFLSLQLSLKTVYSINKERTTLHDQNRNRNCPIKFAILGSFRDNLVFLLLI